MSGHVIVACVLGYAAIGVALVLYADEPEMLREATFLQIIFLVLAWPAILFVAWFD